MLADAQILENAEVGEQIERLENHADLRADCVDVLEVVGQFESVDGDPALLMLFQPIDATDQRRLTGTGGPANDDLFAACDREIDIAQTRGNRRTIC